MACRRRAPEAVREPRPFPPATPENTSSTTRKCPSDRSVSAWPAHHPRERSAGTATAPASRTNPSKLRTNRGRSPIRNIAQSAIRSGSNKNPDRREEFRQTLPLVKRDHFRRKLVKRLHIIGQCSKLLLQ